MGAHPVAPGALVLKDAGKGQRFGQRTVVLGVGGRPVVGSNVVAEGESPEEAQLLPREGAAGVGSRTYLLLTSPGPEVQASKSGAPSSCAVSWKGSSIR